MADKNYAYITGANRGIGLALVREFARNGWGVFAGSRHPESEELAALEREATVTPLSLDVTDTSSVSDAAEAIRSKTDHLDLVINNAGYFPGERDDPFESLDAADLLTGLDVNVAGVIRVTQSVLSLLEKSETPRVVNISSGAASVTTKLDGEMALYSTTKAALNMLTRAMAGDLGHNRIIVTALSPGWVRTEMGGPNAKITPEESAASLFKTSTTLTMEDTGHFMGRNRESYPW